MNLLDDNNGSIKVMVIITSDIEWEPEIVKGTRSTVSSYALVQITKMMVALWSGMNLLNACRIGRGNGQCDLCDIGEQG
jgi:hypothetical protein